MPEGLCNVTVREGKHLGSRTRSTFVAAVDLMNERLTSLGFRGGPFVLEPIKGVRGSSANQGIRVSRDDGLLIIQPQSNDSAWQYRLAVPKTTSLEKVIAALKTRALEPESQPKREAFSKAAPSSETFPQDLLNDHEAIALGLYELFSYLGERVPLDRVYHHIEKQFALRTAFAEQFVQALANRKCVKCYPFRGEVCFGIMPSWLYDLLEELGVPAAKPEGFDERTGVSYARQKTRRNKGEDA